MECGPLDAALYQRRQGLHDAHGFEADGDDLLDEADDIFRLVQPVRVVGDAAPGIGRDLILVNHPLQCRAIPQPIVKTFGRDAFERQICGGRLFRLWLPRYRG